MYPAISFLSENIFTLSQQNVNTFSTYECIFQYIFKKMVNTIEVCKEINCATCEPGGGLLCLDTQFLLQAKLERQILKYKHLGQMVYIWKRKMMVMHFQIT